MAFLDRLAIPRGFGRKVLGRPVRSGRRARFDEVVSSPSGGAAFVDVAGHLEGSDEGLHELPRAAIVRLAAEK
jgi:hypothetical protein